MIDLPPHRCSVFISGQRVASLAEDAEQVRERLARGRPLLVQHEHVIVSVPAEEVERIEDDWHSYAAALSEGFRELIEEEPAPEWGGARVNAG